jgi:hypothetical protein
MHKKRRRRRKRIEKGIESENTYAVLGTYAVLCIGHK